LADQFASVVQQWWYCSRHDDHGMMGNIWTWSTQYPYVILVKKMG